MDSLESWNGNKIKEQIPNGGHDAFCCGQWGIKGDIYLLFMPVEIESGNKYMYL